MSDEALNLRLRETADGYRASFFEEEGDKPYIVFDCNFIEKLWGGIRVTVTVSSDIITHNSGQLPMMFSDRLNILTHKDIVGFAARIDQLIPPPASGARQDWRSHIEAVAIRIQAELDKRIPTEDLAHRVPSPPQQFDIQGILATGKTNILYGPGGIGKSAMAARIATSLFTGETFVGFYVQTLGRTLYLDWEDDPDTMTHRLDAIARGMGMYDYLTGDGRVPLVYQHMHGVGPYERHHADVKNTLHENPDIKLVIIDSTAMAMAGNSQGDGAEGAIKFFSQMAQLPVTRLLIDHVASDDIKKGDAHSGAPKPYGSVFKVNSARNVWEARPWEEERPGSGFTLFHRKSNVGPRLPRKDVGIEWEDEAGEPAVSFTW